MTVELFKKAIEAMGGVQNLVDAREEIAAFVCAIDDVVELEARVSLGVEISEKELGEKFGLMVKMMHQLIVEQ